MPRVVVASKSHHRKGKTFLPGDTFDATESELRAFGDRLELVKAKPQPKPKAKKGEQDAE